MKKTSMKRNFFVIPGVDLPKLIEGDILVTYPMSSSPRRELIIDARFWYGSNQQEFTTLSINGRDLEIMAYGLYRLPTAPIIRLNEEHHDFGEYYKKAIVAGLI